MKQSDIYTEALTCLRSILLADHPEFQNWIDWSMVESFPFPAAFEEQQYIGDEGKIHVYSWDGRQETDLVGPYSVRELYLEHFGK